MFVSGWKWQRRISGPFSSPAVPFIASVCEKIPDRKKTKTKNKKKQKKQNYKLIFCLIDQSKNRPNSLISINKKSYLFHLKYRKLKLGRKHTTLFLFAVCYYRCQEKIPPEKASRVGSGVGSGLGQGQGQVQSLGGFFPGGFFPRTVIIMSRTSFRIIYNLQLPECQGPPCFKKVPYFKFK